MVLDLTSIPQSVQVLFLHEGAERVSCWTDQAWQARHVVWAKRYLGSFGVLTSLKTGALQAAFLRMDFTPMHFIDPCEQVG